MDKFAKLFERDGRQVLVRRGIDDEGEFYLSFETVNPTGTRLTLTMSFNKGSKAKCEAALDSAFNECDEERAFRVIERAPGIDL